MSKRCSYLFSSLLKTIYAKDITWQLLAAKPKHAALGATRSMYLTAQVNPQLVTYVGILKGVPRDSALQFVEDATPE